MSKSRAILQDISIPGHLRDKLLKDRLEDTRQNLKFLSILIFLFVAALMLQHIYFPGVTPYETLWWAYFLIYIVALVISTITSLLSWFFADRLNDENLRWIYMVIGIVLISLTSGLATMDLITGEDTSAFLAGLFILVFGFRIKRKHMSVAIGFFTILVLLVPFLYGRNLHFFVYQSIAIYALMALFLSRNLENSKIEALILREELSEMNAKLKDLSYIDSLTGIHNRRAFFEHINVLVEQCKRYMTDLSIAIIDIDKFKKVNDTLGHAVGDQVLKQIADHLKKVTRNADISARFGGEEFIVALSNTHLNSAQIVMERVRKEIEYLHIPEVDWPITISIGIAMFHPKEELEETMKRADQAMYKCKSAGGNIVKTIEGPPEDLDDFPLANDQS
jgi:diguanylate cyclase (GGDEF)-like protein